MATCYLKKKGSSDSLVTNIQKKDRDGIRLGERPQDGRRLRGTRKYSGSF